MDLRLIDRLDSSFERGCDLVIGTRPSTIDQIKDFPLMPYPCAAYASRTYVERHGAPGEPRDLVHHSCLASLLYGTIWHFYGDEGDVAVNVSPRITVNDAVILREAVIQDLGIAVLPNPLVKEDVEEGRIVLLLAGWRPPPLWLKAHIPAQRMAKPSVLALLDFLRERLAKGPPQIGET
jgi:DNA-binding transcriptional LysR family regulator